MGEWVLFTHEDAGVQVATLELMPGVDEAEILTMQTLPNHRRKGFAQKLLSQALDWAQHQKRHAVWLEVRAGNQAALALYRAAGFEAISMRYRYYADGEDALVMKYSIKAAL